MKKNNLFLIVILLFTSFFCTGCLTITEEITVNKNGSGTWKMTVDGNQLMNLVNMANWLSPNSSFKTMLDTLNFGTIMEQDVDKYKAVKGISNVQRKTLKKNVHSISYNFDNVQVLNKVNSTGNFLSNQYVLKRHRICRSVSYADPIAQKMPAGVNLGLNTLGKGVNFDLSELKHLIDMGNSPTYKVVYHLPSKVKRTRIANKNNLNVEKKDSTVTVKYDLFDFLGNGANTTILKHSIKF